ncbi:hypothetical protein [Sphingomonas qomolangmaensis]|uniref:Spore coat protein U domain-containing protein n=1 Tax=Sphingomonas qomolangmaensis TaxID=2918765 RepID=A0ABY5L6A8_9SPHN|nr:hypothetical protein [Sphingomonas qomolangmaensis]UUL81437.1 hypothetical protein NMP03_09440 [Sphingomonas qomolangmaensis]
MILDRFAAFWCAAGTITFSPGMAVAQDLPDDAECRLEMRVENDVEWRGLYGRGYEVFDQGDEFEVVPITIRHEGAGCRYFITASWLTTGGENFLAGPQDRLRFDLLRDPNGPSVLSPDFAGNQLSRIAGAFRTGASAVSIPLYVSVPAGQFVRGGSYQGQAVIRLFRDDNGPELADEGSVGIAVPVASVLKVESPDAGPGVKDLTVDLGDLTQGSRHTVTFAIRSNANVTARFESANNGALKHSAGAPPIKYDVALAGVPVDLTGTGWQSLAVFGQNEMSVPLDFVVGPQQHAGAGYYSDMVTVTFRAD